MHDLFTGSAYWGPCLTLLGFQLASLLRRRYPSPLLNPILTGSLFVVFILTITGIPYAAYENGTRALTRLLTPATICLAVPMYRGLPQLWKSLPAILIGISAGVVTNYISVYGLAKLFGLSHIQYVTLLPKSITSAIGAGVCAEYGGMVSLTVVMIILTGILGNIIADAVFSLFHINHPVARGVALGASAHAIGAAKALALGDAEGAGASLSIVLTGLITAVTISLPAGLLS